MASEPATESIADNVARALAAFEVITTRETQVELSGSQFTWVRIIDDQLSKFKLWAGNIGAHRTGRRSLDYRLRDSSHLQTQVLRLLDDLVTSLNEGGIPIALNFKRISDRIQCIQSYPGKHYRGTRTWVKQVNLTRSSRNSS